MDINIVRCYVCDRPILKKDRFERAFDIIDYDSNGKKVRKNVNVYACSTACLHMWYDTQDK